MYVTSGKSVDDVTFRLSLRHIFGRSGKKLWIITLTDGTTAALLYPLRIALSRNNKRISNITKYRIFVHYGLP